MIKFKAKTHSKTLQISAFNELEARKIFGFAIKDAYTLEICVRSYIEENFILLEGFWDFNFNFDFNTDIYLNRIIFLNTYALPEKGLYSMHDILNDKINSTFLGVEYLNVLSVSYTHLTLPTILLV